MQRVEQQGNAPLELIAGLTSRHKGLRHIELEQFRGRASYVSCPGHRYDLKRNGELPEHDEAPDDDPETIAAQLIIDARAYVARAGGHEQFRIVCYQARKDGLSKTTVSFGLVDGDSDGDSEGPAHIEARMRAEFATELRGYIGDLHKRDNQHADAIDKVVRVFADGAASLFKTMTEVLIPQMIDLRLDALEDRAEAFELGHEPSRGRRRWTRQESSEPSPGWKEAASSLKELVSGPMFQVGVGKALGVPPDELKAYMEKTIGISSTNATATSSTSESVDVRPTLKKLYFALDAKQRDAFKRELGEDFVKAFTTAGMAGDETTALRAVHKALDGLKEEQFAAFDSILNEAQQAILAELFGQLGRVAETSG